MLLKSHLPTKGVVCTATFFFYTSGLTRDTLTWLANPFCLINLFFFFLGPLSLAFSSPPAFSHHAFFSLSSPPTLYTLFSPPKFALLTRLPYFFPFLLSFLRTTPQSYTTSQFDHCTSESYEFLCSYLFVLLENPRLAFI